MHFLHCSAKEGSNCRNLLTFFFFDVTNFPSLLRCHQPTRLLAQTNSWLRAGSLANTNNLVATDATSPESSVVVFFSLSLSLSLPFCLLFSFPFTRFPGILFHLAFFFFLSSSMHTWSIKLVMAKPKPVQKKHHGHT